MNHTYRLVWNQDSQRYVPAPECAKGHGKSKTAKALAPAAILLSAACALPALAQAPPANALPTGGTVTAGQAAISQSASQMQIKQGSHKAIIDWSSFNIGKNAGVTFQQPNASAIALNRVTAGNASQIHGQLKANGQVWLINPNGVVFGQGSRVDVGGMVASTMNITNADFLKGNYSFNRGSAQGGIVNQGDITAQDGGLIALLAPTVSNDGIIRAQLGAVAMAAGEQITLDAGVDGLLSVQVSPATIQTLIENRQLIVADGGQVIMTGKAADALSASIVTNTGKVQANRVQEKEGRILLLADMHHGETQAAGTLEAGFVETSAAEVTLDQDLQVRTHGGEWLIDPVDITIDATKAAVIQKALAGSNVSISTAGEGDAQGDIHVNANITYTQNRLTLTADNDIHLNAAINVNGSGTLALNHGDKGGIHAKFKDGGGFVGKVNFAQAGDELLQVNGDSYTVIQDMTALQAMSLQGRYALGGDLDASGVSDFAPIGGAANNVASSLFHGVFDGLGHTINNLTIQRPDHRFVGLFRAVYSDGTVRNVGMEGGNVTGGESVGGLVGTNQGTISNSYATSQVEGSGSYVGGLVGYNQASSIQTSYARGDVQGHSDVGGLVGYSTGGSTIQDSYATGQVKGPGSSVGGLVGYNRASSIQTSYATGDVQGFFDSYNVGGLVGYSTGGSTIQDSYATGQVKGSNNSVGGLVGYNSASSIQTSYARGDVQGHYYVGGLVGYSTGGRTIQDSYATGQVEGSGSYVGGLVGANNFGSSIQASYATGEVQGHSYVGGLVGDSLNGSTVQDSYATGQVEGSGSYVGGLVGHNSASSIQTSYATGDVQGGSYVGGLVGSNTDGSTIQDSYYATGQVKGSYEYAGGLVGHNSASSIQTSYATGEVQDGSYVGGLVGSNTDGGTVQDSYWNTQASGQTISDGGTGLTTAQMKDKANFKNWDFENTWVLEDGQYAPGLRTVVHAHLQPGVPQQPTPPKEPQPTITAKQQQWLDKHPKPTVADILVAVGSGLFTNEANDPVWQAMYVDGKPLGAQASSKVFQESYNHYSQDSITSEDMFNAMVSGDLKTSGHVFDALQLKGGATGIKLKNAKLKFDTTNNQQQNIQNLIDEYKTANAAQLMVAVGKGLFSNSSSDPVWSGLYVNGKATAAQLEANKLQPVYDKYNNRDGKGPATPQQMLEGLKSEEIKAGNPVYSALAITGGETTKNFSAGVQLYKDYINHQTQQQQAIQALINEYKNASEAQLMVAVGKGLFVNSPNDPVWSGLYVNGKATAAQLEANKLQPVYDKYNNRDGKGPATPQQMLEGLKSEEIKAGNPVYSALAITGGETTKNFSAGVQLYKDYINHQAQQQQQQQAIQALINEYKTANAAQLMVAVGKGLFVNSLNDPVWSGLYVNGKATAAQTQANSLQPIYDKYNNRDGKGPATPQQMLEGLKSEEIKAGNPVYSALVLAGGKTADNLKKGLDLYRDYQQEVENPPPETPQLPPAQQKLIDDYKNASAAELMVAVGQGLFTNSPNDPVWSGLYVNGAATNRQNLANEFQEKYNRYNHATMNDMLNALKSGDLGLSGAVYDALMLVGGATTSNFKRAMDSYQAWKDAQTQTPETPQLTPEQQKLITEYQNASIADLMVAVGKGLFTNSPSDPVWSGLYVSGTETNRQNVAKQFQEKYNSYNRATMNDMLNALKNGDLGLSGAVYDALMLVGGATTSNFKRAMDSYQAWKDAQTQTPETPQLTPEQQKLITEYQNASIADLMVAVGKGLFTNSPSDPVWSGLYVSGKETNRQNVAKQSQEKYNSYNRATMNDMLNALKNGDLGLSGAVYDALMLVGGATTSNFKRAMDSYQAWKDAQADAIDSIPRTGEGSTLTPEHILESENSVLPDGIATDIASPSSIEDWLNQNLPAPRDCGLFSCTTPLLYKSLDDLSPGEKADLKSLSGSLGLFSSQTGFKNINDLMQEAKLTDGSTHYSTGVKIINDAVSSMMRDKIMELLSSETPTQELVNSLDSIKSALADGNYTRLASALYEISGEKEPILLKVITFAQELSDYLKESQAKIEEDRWNRLMYLLSKPEFLNDEQPNAGGHAWFINNLAHYFSALNN